MKEIYIKDEEEVCMYCPSCGKETLHMNASIKDLFSCSECLAEFAMMSKEDYYKLK